MLSPARYKYVMNTRTEYLQCYDSLSCIFIHVPKTGGLSIGNALFNRAPSWHLSVRAYCLMYSGQEYRQFFKFAFVRDPWDRVASAYRFLTRGGVEERDRKWRDDNLRADESLRDFVKRWLNPRSARSEIHFVPQIEFLRRVPWGPVEVDFVGRFENLAEDFEEVCRRLGVFADLGHVNRTSSSASEEGSRSAYDREAMEIVAEVYRDDILTFGYRF